ncbi:hypothetical protein GCM10010471_12890 [Leucobacter komagatae]
MVGAESVLRGLLEYAPARALRVRALVVQGELTHPHDAEGGRGHFSESLQVAQEIDGADDLLAVELRVASEMLVRKQKRPQR